ncbi:MAG: hypothetical protein LBP63_09665 [Prevotellaceae bacterium]|jgi:hypothetical protein|nr:hypothetical protein [Prevotellaceae bacterium]
MIFPIKQWGKEKSSTFAAEIHSRNGLMLFHEDFSGGSAGGIPAEFFYVSKQKTGLLYFNNNPADYE